MQRFIWFLTLLLHLSSINAGIKSFIIAIPVENVDCGNLIGSSADSGKVYDAVQSVNYATREVNSPELKFIPEQPLHATLVYVGQINDKHSDFDEILKDLRRFFKVIADAWMKERADKTVIKSSLSQLLWPPLGKKGTWLAYRASISQVGEKDLLAFTNSMHIGVSNLNSLHKNAVRNARGIPISRETLTRLDALDLHVSLGRFNKGYSANPPLVFGVPEKFKSMIDTKFQALPAPVQPNFDVSELVLYMKDEQHQIQILEKVSLIPPGEKLTQ